MPDAGDTAKFEYALLEAIRATPDSDELRFELARCLCTAGRSAARAQLIRAQIKLAAISPDAPYYSSALAEVKARVKDSLLDLGFTSRACESVYAVDGDIICSTSERPAAHAERFERLLVEDENEIHLVFRRGLLEGIAASHDVFPELPLNVFRKSCLRDLAIQYIWDGHRHIEEPLWQQCLERLLLVLPYCRLTHLDLSDFRTRNTDLIRKLFTSPALREVVKLEYDFGWVDADIMREIASSYRLSNIRELVLGAFGLDDDGLIAIARSPFLVSLDHILIRSDDHYAPARGNGWNAMTSRFGDRAHLDIHMGADASMYNYDDEDS